MQLSSYIPFHFQKSLWRKSLVQSLSQSQSSPSFINSHEDVYELLSPFCSQTHGMKLVVCYVLEGITHYTSSNSITHYKNTQLPRIDISVVVRITHSLCTVIRLGTHSCEFQFTLNPVLLPSDCYNCLTQLGSFYLLSTLMYRLQVWLIIKSFHFCCCSNRIEILSTEIQLKLSCSLIWIPYWNCTMVLSTHNKFHWNIIVASTQVLRWH